MHLIGQKTRFGMHELITGPYAQQLQELFLEALLPVADGASI